MVALAAALSGGGEIEPDNIRGGAGCTILDGELVERHQEVVSDAPQCAFAHGTPAEIEQS